MRIIFVYNSKCARTILNKVLNSSGLVTSSIKGNEQFTQEGRLFERTLDASQRNILQQP